MSEGEHFLDRWARRKQKATLAKKSAAGEPGPGEAEKLSADEDEQVREVAAPVEPVKEAAEGFDLNSLPPIESIAATTDIRPFLAPGVPAELQRAALRKAWSSDPAIRDFVGLSENSWDFNDPNGMHGFGPLELTDEFKKIVAEMLAPSRTGESDQAVKAEPETMADAGPPKAAAAVQTAIAEEPAPARVPDFDTATKENNSVRDILAIPRVSNDDRVAMQREAGLERKNDVGSERKDNGASRRK